ncbi:MAG: hypothetical protein EXS11_09650 [Gemmataceae bacterium]|nr:hypothetical protein [Gemmataceae bacterium]
MIRSRFFLSFACLCLIQSGYLKALDSEKIGEMAKSLNDAQARGGNSELMAQKWQALVAESQAAVPEILNAMDAAKPLGLNWLRPALDAVLEKEKPTLKTISTLESFVKNSANDGIARRQAFEWLQKLDETKAKQLVPGFLTDINPDLRRDAVASEISSLKSLPKGIQVTNKGKAILKVACDLDQVTELAKILKTESVEVDLLKHYGFLTDWAVLGIFDNTKELGFEKAYAVEPRVDPTKTYQGKGDKPAKWFTIKTNSPEGFVDFNKLIGKEKSAIAYAWTKVESPTDQEVEIRLGCITSLKVWLNGEWVFQRDEYHHGQNPNQHIARCKLKKGTNDLLVKVCQNNQTEPYAQNWQLQARFTDFAGYRADVKQAALPMIPVAETSKDLKETK